MDNNLIDDFESELKGLPTSFIYMLSRVVLISTTFGSIYWRLIDLPWQEIEPKSFLFIFWFRIVVDVFIVIYLTMHLKSDFNDKGSIPVFKTSSIKAFVYVMAFKVFLLSVTIFYVNQYTIQYLTFIAAMAISSGVILKRELDFFRWSSKIDEFKVDKPSQEKD